MNANRLYILILFLVFSVAPAQCWKSVSVGYTHALAIAANGTLWAWGGNNHGQLGIGTNVNQTTPIQVGTDADWKTVSAGSGPFAFTLAQKNDGTLWAWGNNRYGQLGDGTFVNKSIPVQVNTDTDWKSISAGYSHILATKNNGTLWSWGNSDYYALGNTSGYGDGLHRNIPAQVGTLSTWNLVSAADRYSLALQNNGTVYGWGYNSGNPVGATSSNYIMTPQARSYNSTGVKFMSAGGSHSYDVKSANSLLVTWGSNVYGQTGNTTCAGCVNYYVKDTDCGNNTSAIIKTNGSLWYTGVKLGYPSTSTVQLTNDFLQLGTASNWKSVSVGNQSAAAITTTGELWTWGWNFWGCLGNGNTTDSMTLVPISCPAALNTADFQVHPKCSIFPNPANEQIEITGVDNNQIVQLWATDLAGKKYALNQTSDHKLNIAALATGMYLLHVQFENRLEVLKFIKR
ncbi:MAG: hypothetical protein CFE24_02475 [Flavobacterium sp. BFFFF2]|nr:MAG: hypothetical protein CFE24_02475 [Flavobacterium sp. BFFFF2]